MKTTLLSLLLCLACGSAQAAHDQASSALSNASGLLAQGSATVVDGSLAAMAASGAIVVASVQVAGDASTVVLTGSADGVSATLRLSGEVVEGASLVAGTSVGLVALSTGYLLVAAGKVLAFIPNEIGRALLHHSRVGG